MFIDLAKKRRSVKEYTSKQVEQEKLDSIVEVALRAPSGRASRPCEFVVVTDKELLEKLSVAKPMGAEFINNATAGIVVCADPSKSGLWVEDCAIVGVSMQYAAHSLGLASRWAHMRGNNYSDGTSSRDYIAGLLGIPDNLEIECIIALGYPDEEIPPYGKDELDFSKVNYNSYGQKSA